MGENKETFMNLMTDFGFKRLFGTEKFKHILIRFLNILFKEDGIHVDDVIYHDKEVLPPDPNGKRIVYDVYCTSVKDRDREHFIVEMQQVYHSNFEKRVMYYLSNALTAQCKKGRMYDLDPVFGIFIVDFNFKHLYNKLVQDFRMMESETHQVFSNIMRLLIVSLEEVKPTWEECKTELEQITFIIKNMHLMDKNSEAYKSKKYEDMFDAAEISSMAAEDVVTYGQSQRKLEDMQLAYDWARSEGYNQGIEKGIEKGIEQGKEQGIIEGREEGIRLTARKLFDNGIDPDFILQITGLTPEQY